MPQRIQRKRTKGWKMPANALSVTRPGKYGNQYRIFERKGMWIVSDEDNNDWQFETKTAAASWAVEMFEHTLPDELDLSELRGKDLACFCPLDQPCHADILLRLANEKG